MDSLICEKFLILVEVAREKEDAADACFKIRITVDLQKCASFGCLVISSRGPSG